MRRILAYFLLMNLAYFALVVGICTAGEWYDKAYKLYPETVWFAYDVSIAGVYGERWRRFWEISVLIGIVANPVAGFAVYRIRRSEKQDTPSISLH